MFTAKRTKTRVETVRKLAKRHGVSWRHINAFLGVDLYCANAESLDRLIMRLRAMGRSVS